jgi:FkbM family methyltransferase
METALELATRNAEKARFIAIWALTANLPKPLIYADVGALWGTDNNFIRLLGDQKRLRMIGFEPDESECARLRQGAPDDIYLPIGVGDEDRTRQFYVTMFGANSSFLEPDLAAFRGWPHAETFRVVRTVDLPMRRFDSLIGEGAIPQPDFLKIDAQGFELNVLKGCGERLRDVIGIRLETQLRPLYKGQATFFDIHAFLLGEGHILRDLRLTQPIGHEVVEMEAFFSQDPALGQDLGVLKIWELIHDIPPGRTVQVNGSAIQFTTLML